MNQKKEKLKLIKSARAALVELNKVATQVIDLSELDPEKAKTAAAAKKQAIFDAFDIIERINQEEEMLEEKPKEETTTTSFGGFAESRAK